MKDIRVAVAKGSPLGGDAWRDKLIKSLKLSHTTRSVGSQKMGPDPIYPTQKDSDRGHCLFIILS